MTHILLVGFGKMGRALLKGWFSNNIVQKVSILDPLVNKEQTQLAEKLLNSIGEVIYLEDESLMDAVTAISGSGPAYFYYFVEAIVYSGISIGLSKKHSLKLAKETFLGAAVLLEKSNEEVSSLRENVTSPGGTTEAALKTLQKNNQYFKLVKKAIISARNRGIELSDEFK